MKLRMIPIAALGACMFPCAIAHAQADYSTWGIKAGLFMPSGSEIRRVFGDNWVSFGLSPQQKVARSDLTFGGDVGVIIANSNGNRLLLIPVTAGYTKLFAPRQNAVVPYGAVRAGVAYYDYSISRGLAGTFSK